MKLYYKSLVKKWIFSQEKSPTLSYTLCYYMNETHSCMETDANCVLNKLLKWKKEQTGIKTHKILLPISVYIYTSEDTYI